MVLGWQPISSSDFFYGAFTLYGGPFQVASNRRTGEGGCTHNSTSHHGFPRRFGLAWSPFTRRYSGSLVLISSPHPTWMLPFGWFPLQGLKPGATPTTEVVGVRKSHSGIPGSTPACGYPGLIAACHALPRPPSRVIHRLAYSGLRRLLVQLATHPYPWARSLKAVSFFRFGFPSLGWEPSSPADIIVYWFLINVEASGGEARFK